MDLKGKGGTILFLLGVAVLVLIGTGMVVSGVIQEPVAPERVVVGVIIDIAAVSWGAAMLRMTGKI